MEKALATREIEKRHGDTDGEKVLEMERKSFMEKRRRERNRWRESPGERDEEKFVQKDIRP